MTRIVKCETCNLIQQHGDGVIPGICSSCGSTITKVIQGEPYKALNKLPHEVKS